MQIRKLAARNFSRNWYIKLHEIIHLLKPANLTRKYTNCIYTRVIVCGVDGRPSLWPYRRTPLPCATRSCGVASSSRGPPRPPARPPSEPCLPMKVGTLASIPCIFLYTYFLVISTNYMFSYMYYI